MLGTPSEGDLQRPLDILMRLEVGEAEALALLVLRRDLDLGWRQSLRGLASRNYPANVSQPFVGCIDDDFAGIAR